MDATDQELVDTLQDTLDGSLRVVAEYDTEGYRFLHRRPDVDDLYTPEDLDTIFEDLVIQGLGRDYLETLFHAGELDCTLHKFDDAVVCHFIDEYRGVVVSFDADVDLGLLEFLEECAAAVERRGAG